MITAGAMEERVTVLVPTTTRGAMNEQVTTYEAAKEVWARVVYKKGDSALTLGEGWMTGSISVEMRWNTLVTDRCRLRWDGKTYQIDSINRRRKEGRVDIVASVTDKG